MSGAICVMLDPDSTSYCTVSHGDLTDGVFTEATPTQGSRFISEMNAVGNGDGTITVTNLANNSTELFELGWAVFVDAELEPHGVDEATTVDSLNAVFHRTGVVPLAPVITSPTTVSAAPGDPINYIITATESPFLFVASGLPAGLLVNQATGQILGGAPVAGTYPFTVAAANVFGSDSQVVTLTSSAGYHNALSTRFKQNKSNFAKGVSPVPLPGAAWTRSLWVKSKDKTHGLSFAGDDSSSEGWSITLDKASKTLEIVGGAAGDWVSWGSAAAVWAVESWHHIVVVYSGALPLAAAGLTIYVDGVDITAGGAVGSAGSYASAAWSGSSNALTIAKVPGEAYFEGWADEVSSWSKALSGVEVAALRSGATPADLSGHAAFVASCDGWWRMGDGDTFPALTDHSGGSRHLAMLNMTAAAFESDVPV